MATPRPDLANIEPRLPNYIHETVAPKTIVRLKASTMHYLDIEEVQEATPETSRALGEAPNATVHGEKSLTYSTAEKVKRRALDKTSLETQYGGDLNAAERSMAMSIIRTLHGAVEEAVADAVMGDTSNTAIDNTSGSIIEDVGEAYGNIDFGSGAVVAVMSRSTRRALLGLDEIKGIAGISNEGTAPAALFSDQLIAQLLGVDMVFVGEDDRWGNGGGYADQLAVMRLPAPDADPRDEAQALRNLVYYSPEEFADSPFQVFTHESDDRHSYVVDGFLYHQVQVLNGAMIQNITNIGA